MTRRLLLLFLAALGGLAGLQDSASDAQAVPEDAAPAVPVTIICTRHAEKASAEARDPELSEAGEARAAELARLVGSAGVTHLFSTEYRRTLDTLGPLAELSGVEVETYSPRDLGAFAELLAALPPGSIAVVSGHSNTTPALVRALGGRTPSLGEGDLDESTYDRLWIVTIPAVEPASPASLELRYGATSE